MKQHIWNVKGAPGVPMSDVLPNLM